MRMAGRGSSLRVFAPALAIFAASLALPAGGEQPDVRVRMIAPERAPAGSTQTIAVVLTVGSKWHVNSHTPSEPYLIPTNVAITSSGGGLSPVRYPADVTKRFSFSEKPLRVYEGTVRFEADLEIPSSGAEAISLSGQVSYQACDDRQCYAPRKAPIEATIAVR